MSKTIYVGNLSYSTTDEDLRGLFAQYGTVESARVVMDRDTGRSRGFGFVDLAEDDAAAKAIQALNETEFQGRSLRVNEARPRSNDRRPPRRDNSRW